jgi:hypothetical protein
MKREGTWIYYTHEIVAYFVEYLGRTPQKEKYLTVTGTSFGWGMGVNEIETDKEFNVYEPKKIDFRRAIKTVFIGPRNEVRTTIQTI